MPLLDHFRPPLYPRRRWTSVHAAWAVEIADALNNGGLPKRYFAEVFAHAGPRVEIDVATFADDPPGAEGGVATAVYAPPAPRLTVPSAIPDEYAVRVYGGPGDAVLVGAIELVSPANKDREESRRAFVTKCGGYLAQGVSLIVADVVTTYRVNLHAEIMTLLGQSETGLPADADLYAAAYRPIVRGTPLIEVWPEPIAVGADLPTLPLALSAGVSVPIHLEATYTAACRRLQLP